MHPYQQSEKSKLLSSMKKREAEVAKCVNDLIAYQQLENANKKSGEATNTSS